MSKIRVAIYNGDLYPTTFVKLLAKNLNIDGFSIGLFGTSNKLFRFKKDGLSYIPSDTNSKILLVLLFFIRTLQMCILKPLILWRIVKLLTISKKKLRFKLKQYLTWSSLLLCKTDVLHIQWVSHLSLFEEILGCNFFKIGVSLRGRLINITPFVNDDVAVLYERTFSKLDFFHAVSSYTLFDGQCFGCLKNNTEIIFAAVSDRFVKSVLKPYNYNEIEPIKIISIGRDNWVKGYIYSLKALKILKESGVNFEYTIVRGYSEELVFYVNNLGLTDEVRFIDEIPNEKLPVFMDEFSIMLFPSISEGMGNVVIEAMALGLVVVATKSGGVEDVIIHNENGYLSEIYDSESIANTLLKVIYEDNKKIELIRRNAQTTILNNHLLSSQVKKMSDLYKKVYQ